MAKTLKKPASSRSSNHEPTDDSSRPQRQLEELAYHLWRKRGSPEGSPDQDWFVAERMLQANKAEDGD